MPLVAVADIPLWLAVLAACSAAAASLAVRDPRRRVRAMIGAGVLAVGIVGLEGAGSITGSLADHLPALGILAGAGVIAVGGLAAVFARWPVALPVALIAVLPFRLPLEIGSSTVSLLAPLYAVIAAGVAVTWWRERAAGKAAPATTPEPPERVAERRKIARGWAGAPRRLQLALAAVVALYGLQAGYSDDVGAAARQAGFFLVPFTLLFSLLAHTQWTRRLAVTCFGVLMAEALVFSLVGLYEYQAREVFWNAKVISSNQFETYFRVNSVFFDPNIFGRFLALVMLGVTAWLVWLRRSWPVLGLAVALAVLWAGMVVTLSQSSFAALMAGLAVVAALRWSWRWTAAALGAGVVAALVVVFGFGSLVRLDTGSDRSIDRATSGRSKLVEGGLGLVADRPLIGHGSGSFSRAYRDRQDAGQREAVSASHTEPITVAAEQGVLGIAAYVALLAGAVATLLTGLSRSAPGLGGGRSGGPPPVVRVGLAAAFGALFVHSLAYAAFLSDPMTWALLGTAVAFAVRAQAIEPQTRQPPAEPERPVPEPAG
ncbi:MAG: O-antigen ligase family protein [Solirubrobacterales bacterium]